MGKHVLKTSFIGALVLVAAGIIVLLKRLAESFTFESFR